MSFAILIIFAVLLFLAVSAVLVLILVGKKYGGTGILVFVGLCLAIMTPLLLITLVGVRTASVSTAPTIIQMEPDFSMPSAPTPLPGMSVELSSEQPAIAPPSPPSDTPVAAPAPGLEPGEASGFLPGRAKESPPGLTMQSGNRQMAVRSGGSDQPVRVNNLKIEYRSGAVGWGSSEFDQFTASHYPGMDDCAAPIAKMVAEFVNKDESVSGGKDSQAKLEFEVLAEDSITGTEFVSGFVRELKTLIPDSTVRLVNDQVAAESPDSTTKTKLTLFAVTYQNDPAAGGQSADGSFRTSDLQGQVHCRLEHDGVLAKLSTKFIDKPWVFHYDELISRFPDQQLIVGYSDPLSESESSARESAFRSAQDQVRVSTSGGVRLELDERQIVDRFAQKLTRPYGDVWREAVLVDLASPSLQDTSNEQVAAAAKDTNKRDSQLFFITLLVGLVVILCLAANGLTQGYYRRRLGIGIGGVLFLAVIVLLLNVA